MCFCVTTEGKYSGPFEGTLVIQLNPERHLNIHICQGTIKVGYLIGSPAKCLIVMNRMDPHRSVTECTNVHLVPFVHSQLWDPWPKCIPNWEVLGIKNNNF